MAEGEWHTKEDEDEAVSLAASYVAEVVCFEVKVKVGCQDVRMVGVMWCQSDEPRNDREAGITRGSRKGASGRGHGVLHGMTTSTCFHLLILLLLVHAMRRVRWDMRRGRFEKMCLRRALITLPKSGHVFPVRSLFYSRLHASRSATVWHKNSALWTGGGGERREQGDGTFRGVARGLVRNRVDH